MKIGRYSLKMNALALGWLIFLPGALAACTANPVASVPRSGTEAPLYVPPTRLLPSPTTVPLTSTPAELRPVATPACTNHLTFQEDLSIPDGTQVTPGQELDKRWEVENSGTCNWDDRYSLRLIAGNNLGVQSELALYPARSGARAPIRILFTAPDDPGEYRSAWQAYDPEGESFGDQIFIDIVIAEP